MGTHGRAYLDGTDLYRWLEGRWWGVWTVSADDWDFIQNLLANEDEDD